MRVLLFARSLHVGGTERQLCLLARGLVERGQHVTMVLLYGDGEMEAALDPRIELKYIGKAGRWDIAGPLLRLRRVLADERPDVIYSFLPMQNVLAAILRPSGARLAFGVRSSGMQLEHYDRLSALSYRAEAWLAGRADAIIANAYSFIDAAPARGFAPERVAIVPNGIDTTAMRIDPEARTALRRGWGFDDGAFLVGMVARLDPMKDHGNFLSAAADFAQRYPNAHFICVGGGAAAGYREALLQQARDLGIANRVTFVGELQNVAVAYNALDIGTLASAFGEGFPNVVGEAMACGLPMAVTDVGDARMVVGELGAVVPPRRPDLLSIAWAGLRQRLIEDAGFRFAARERIQIKFSVDAMVRSTEKILMSVCAT